MITREDIQYNDWFLREITEKGEVLYRNSNFFPKPLTISEHAVDLRYPSKFATNSEAEQAMEICIKVRQAIRSELKLPQNQIEGQA